MSNPQLLPHEAQIPSNMGQPRQGPPNQNTMPTKGHQQFLCDPQLAQFTLIKGDHPSWKEVEPEQVHISLNNLRRELERIQSKNEPVTNTLNEITSINARATVTGLVNNENKELRKLNPNLKWTLAGIELKWRLYNHRGTKKQLRRIDVILQTEAHPLMKIGKPAVNAAVMGFDSQDPLRSGKANGAMQEQHPRSQMPNEGHDQGPKMKNNINPNATQNPHFNQPPPPPPPPPPMDPNMMQHMPNQPPPHGPRNGNPNPHSMGQHVQHERQPNIQHQSGPHTGMRDGGGRVPPIEVIDPFTRQQQKAPKKVPGEFPRELDDFEGDSDSSDTHSLTAESTDEGYNAVRGRSRSVNRNKSKSRTQSGWRSRSRGRVEKMYKEKMPHSQMRSEFYPPPLGEHSRKSSKPQTPKSSSGNLAPNIKISVNTTATPTNAGENDREQARGRDGRRSHDDNNSRDRPRERSDDRRWKDYEREYKRSSYDTSASTSPRQSFTKFEKATSQPMSRHSSGYSETLLSQDTSSTQSVVDGSVFDEPIHGRRKSRHHNSIDGHRPNSPTATWRRSNENVYHHFDRRANDCEDADDYPENHHRVYRRSNHGRPVLHQGDTFHDGEHWGSDQDSSIASWPQVGHVPGHRGSMGFPNPFNTSQFPSQRSPKYIEHHSEPAYSYYASQKALPEPQMQQDAFNMHEMERIFQAGVEAINNKERNAFNHIRSSRRPLGRSNTLNGGGHPKPVDAWSNPSYPADQRTPATLPDGRVVYLHI